MSGAVERYHRHRRPAPVRPALLGILLLLPLLSATGAAAQEWGIPPTVLRRADLPDHARLLLRELNRPVELTLVDGNTVRGILADVSASDLTLKIGALPHAEMRAGYGWHQISGVKVDRRGRVLEGLLLGGASGALAGVLTARDDDPRRDVLGMEVAEPTWDSFLSGAAAGALLGLLRGWDFTLPINPQVTSLVGPLGGAGQRERPAVRFVSSIPLWSGVLNDVAGSMSASQWVAAEGIELERPWFSWNAMSLALETTMPGRGRWWARGRLEYFILPRLSRSSFCFYPPDTVTVPADIWRDYQATRIFTGVSRPLAGPGRLPTAEVSFLLGVERTSLKSGADFCGYSSVTGIRQTIWRPLLYAGGSLAILRRPDLTIALRIEAVVGNGFVTDSFKSPEAGEILPARRIRPTALHIGLDFFLPVF